MKTALVLGANGQDGSLAVEHLLRRGYRVVGLGRQPSTRIAAIPSYTYHCTDLRDADLVRTRIATERPDVVLHLAAVHGSSGFQYEPVFNDVLAVNIGSLHAVLEEARLQKLRPRVVYASSSKVFGNPLPIVVDEDSPRMPTCLYSLSKITAEELLNHYDRHHGISGSALYLFNHESERRATTFFIPRVVAALRSALVNGSNTKGLRITLQNLDFHCDWGSASEFMDIAVDVAERAPAGHYCVATGSTWTGRTMVQALFARHGLNYANFIDAPSEVPAPGYFQVTLNKLETAIGRRPRQSILDVCENMLTASTTDA
ncbi:NAD-dependent epimerase/dehydratase family protein [Azospirillum melinis]|uniref:GDP-mannose 4,6-dehydratase n=1 Tax=Azospirillum melinis TaxID=328839 RepID=A0ABX2KL27_9PROT|nr:GDP-mannose 4,6-dehydratase [Azospirillum melinis]MBP2307296.1 GDPmannose 4,6-dehydratase [Azospirillum melinis]NUB01390.1 NAD-dependent epimerase/dehydratase family protein [Azospirillum melinis]